ncbi:MAG TPA: hypothetical protein VML19_17160 [Verrucomicrobiae bacterium]|nr:hypothetical protein [Verrucomicrobiae bacterium]
MRFISASLLFAALLPVLPGAAPDGLSIIDATLSRSDDGVNEAKGTEHAAGELLFFTCRIANYTKTAEQKINLAYSVQAFDPKGVALLDIYKNQIAEEVAPQDKEWLPKISTEIELPPALLSGTYKITVNVEDTVAHTKATLDVPFRVHGHAIEATQTLSVQNMKYYKGEDDAVAMTKAVYKAGDALWVRFDVTGYKYGENNKVHLNYIFSVLGADGAAIWTAPQPIVEESEAVYPKPFVSGAFSIQVQSAVKPGEYAIGVKAVDLVGKQTVEAKQPFTVQ